MLLGLGSALMLGALVLADGEREVLLEAAAAKAELLEGPSSGKFVVQLLI